MKNKDCIELTCCKNGGGYSVVRFYGRNERCHRIAFASANCVTLDSLKGIEIRHKCDNPACVNPAHLEAGTHADNMRDMYTRARRTAAVGERASKAKLTAAQVLEIRRRIAVKESDASIARFYKLNPTSILAIRAGRSWRHV